jgi:hypothetical protein
MNDPNKAIDYVIANAGKFAQAKANRIYLEEFRKSKKALLMNQSTEKTVNAREQYAYSHDEYLALLDGLKAAVEVEEKLKWEMQMAQARVEVWKATIYTDNRTDKAMR